MKAVPLVEKGISQSKVTFVNFFSNLTLNVSSISCSYTAANEITHEAISGRSS